MDEPVWVRKSVVLASHDEQLRIHGGRGGIRDEGLLDSALNRPRNLFAYGEPDLADLAAAYAFGLVKNHAFIDGNKRTSNVVAETFLLLNGAELDATDAEKIEMWLALASGDVTEDAMAHWLRKRLQPAVP